MKMHKVFVKNEQVFQMAEQHNPKEMLKQAKQMNPKITHVMVHVGKQKKAK